MCDFFYAEHNLIFHANSFPLETIYTIFQTKIRKGYENRLLSAVYFNKSGSAKVCKIPFMSSVKQKGIDQQRSSRSEAT